MVEPAGLLGFLGATADWDLSLEFPTLQLSIRRCLTKLRSFHAWAAVRETAEGMAMNTGN
jgi:hypothetical protein